MTRFVPDLLLIFVIIGITLNSAAARADSKNGFDLMGSLVPANEIHSGGPPKDGIPAIDSPRFVKALDARYLKPGARVLGIHTNGVTKAYPVAIMNWHEIVNDRFADEHVIVTFCPLCGTGVAFRLNDAQQAMSFGVSGLLYNSDVLLYDRQTNSLWSQLLAKAVTGPMKGKRLQQIPMAHTSWKDWQSRHPDTLVLSRDTGYRRDYGRDPYASYLTSDGTYFPVKHKDPRYHPKERVIGVEINGHFKAYPFSELARTSGVITDNLDGQAIQISYDDENQTGTISTAEGTEIPSTIAFWFAWYAFHQDTDVFRYHDK